MFARTSLILGAAALAVLCVWFAATQRAVAAEAKGDALKFEAENGKVEVKDGAYTIETNKKTGKWTVRGMAWSKVAEAKKTAAFSVKLSPASAPTYGVTIGSSAVAKRAISVVLRPRTGEAVIDQFDNDTKKQIDTVTEKGFKVKDLDRGPVTIAVDLEKKKITFTCGKLSAQADLKVNLGSIDCVGVFGVNGSDTETVQMTFTEPEFRGE